MGDDDSMTGGELLTIREWLGLSQAALSALIGPGTSGGMVSQAQIKDWERGRSRIPERIRQVVEAIEVDTAEVVTSLIAALGDARDPAVVVYRHEEAWQAAVAESVNPGLARFPASWWRQVVARACQEVPGVVIGTRAELDALDIAALSPASA